MFGFTAFEVHDEVDVSFVLLRSIVDVSFMEGIPVIFKHSLLEFVDKAPEMLEDSVLKSPTRPEVAGEDVVLVGEFEHVVRLNVVFELFSLMGGGNDVLSSEEYDVVPLLITRGGTLSNDLFVEELLSLESVGRGNSSK